MCLTSIDHTYTKARRVEGYKVVLLSRAGNYLSACAKRIEFFYSKLAKSQMTRKVRYSYKKGVKYLAEPAKTGVGISNAYTSGFHVFKTKESAQKYIARFHRYARGGVVIVKVSGMATCWGQDRPGEAYLCKDLTFHEIVRG